MEKIWEWPQPVSPDVQAALSEFTLAQQQILMRRDLRSKQLVQSFFNAVDSANHDPFDLPDLKDAVDRICAAKEKDEIVVVYGDYDADGITATVLLQHALSSLGILTKRFIPDRFLQGYGLHTEALRKLLADGASLIITVDCGIRAVEQAEWARKSGLDLVITDHHEPGDKLPEAVAVVNPKRKDSQYPFRGLAGVGIAYKLAQALMQVCGRPDPEEDLDLVAIGTVADMAPLIDENRMLVSRGLALINQSPRPGLQALLPGARLEEGRITAGSIGFGIGPRLNAAGRLGEVDVAVDLLQASDLMQADVLAGILENLNRQRRQKTEEAVIRARMLLKEQSAPHVMALIVDDAFDEGIVGLVANRISDEINRPAFIGVLHGETARGSARSIPGVDINAVLAQCEEHVVRFGGHAAAAGFTVEMAKFEEFRTCLQRAVEQRLLEIDHRPRIDIDAQIAMHEVEDHGMLSFLDRLEPCGQSNPRPLLGMRKVSIASRRAVGVDGKHLKLMLPFEDHFIDAIAFRKGALADVLPTEVDVAFHLERNIYRGSEKPQLNIQEIRPAQESE